MIKGNEWQQVSKEKQDLIIQKLKQDEEIDDGTVSTYPSYINETGFEDEIQELLDCNYYERNSQISIDYMET